jgi:hypothetical protein
MTLAIVTEAWSTPSLTLTKDTVFQARTGNIILDIGGTAADGSLDGYLMTANPEDGRRDGIVLPTGTVVRWRKVSGKAPATLYYDPVGA